MNGIPESEHWPEPEDRPIRQSKVILYSTLGTGLFGMLVMALFMGHMAHEGFVILEEPGATDNLQVLVGALAGGMMGLIGGALLGGVAGIVAALVEQGSDGPRNDGGFR
jgi:hypothetical protein